MSKMSNVYDVEDIRMGDKNSGDIIIFKSLEDMEQAYADIDNGKDIYVKKEGLVTKLLHQMINAKVYDGTITLSARPRGNETVGGKK